MSVIKEEMIPSLIANTTMSKGIVDGVLKVYNITPNEGYVLHDKDLDYYAELDEDGNETGDIILGFYAGRTSVRYDYDFTANQREFYAITDAEYETIKKEQIKPMEKLTNY